MAQQLHDDPGVLAGDQQHRGRGVPGIVQPDVADTGVLQQRAPGVVVGLLVDRSTARLSEDQILVLPLRSGQHPLTGLKALVLDQGAQQGRRQGELALALVRLGCLIDQALALDAVQGPVDLQRAAEQIDVRPLQRKGFGLPQAEGERHDPAGSVAPGGRRTQHRDGLGRLERGRDGGLALGRRIDQGGDVAVDALALHRDLERPGQNAMDAEHARRRQTLLQKQLVELFKVLGLQTIKALSAQIRGDVEPDHRLVALQRSRSDPVRRDGRQPVIQPCGDGVAVDRGDRPGLTPDLQLANLLGDLASGLGRAMAPIRLAVGLRADRDPPVPASVAALEDARLAGGAFGAHREPPPSLGHTRAASHSVISGSRLVPSATDMTITNASSSSYSSS